MRLSVVVLVSFSMFCSCASVDKTLRYGFLPGSDYEFFAPLNPVDLKGRRYALKVVDGRTGDRISCSGATISRDSELEGATGYDFFVNYLRTMIEANGGVVDQSSTDVIEVRLTVLSANMGRLFEGAVWGYAEFHSSHKGQSKVYCSAMRDGDPGAPADKWSVDTRRGAFRKMVAGAARKALEDFMRDLAKLQNVNAV
jgi:hypothetical protein